MDFDNEDDTIDESIDAFEKLSSKVRYVVPRASAGWRPGFNSVLRCSHSMRVEKVSRDQKEAARAYSGICMACGRKEQNCNYVIDLAGNFDLKEWTSDAQGLTASYKRFVEEYCGVFEESWNPKNGGGLPAVDKGRFVVGSTCLRKAKLTFQAQTLLLEACYSAERQIEERREQKKPINDSELYTATNRAAERFVAAQDSIELAVADERRAVPDLLIDESFWERIDEARTNSFGDESDFCAAIRERSEASMSSSHHAQEARNEGDEENGSVVESDEEEGDEESDQDVMHGSRGKRQRTCRVVHDDDLQETSAEASSSTDVGAPQGRESNRLISVSGMVGKRRAEGSLSSRRDAMLALMELQLSLAREGRLAQAAVCGNAAMTISELLDRVEHLAHTENA